MPRFIKRSSRKIGLPPGTLVHVGERKTEKVRMTLMDYDQERFEEKEIKAIEESFPLKDEPTVTWINVDGLHQVDLVEKIGKQFQLHPLILEDILHTGQRPKMDDFDDYIFVVLKMLDYDEKEEQVKAEQVSLVLGPHFLISFQEIKGDVFSTVRERIRKGKGRIRKMGSDYLAYALIDAIVDRYFIILEIFGEKIESLEDELISDPKPRTLENIHDIKREMIFLRKHVWPLRELIGGMARGETSLIGETTAVYLRDVYDHTIQVIDTIESYRDVLSGMLDLYLSTISNKMNEVMKVLTIIATIFIPLTFIAGVYGMNFKFMPELEWHWAYPVAMLLMLAIAISMLFFFRRRKWL